MATYLLKRSNTYYFRWSFKDTEGYKQLKVSLQTSDYLKALNLSTHLALQIKSLINPCLSEIRAVLSEFSKSKRKEATSLESINIDSFLDDLSDKSRVEYRSCWKSFVAVANTSVEAVCMADIEHWKKSQTCSATTLKKKLRLLSSCFNRIGIKHQAEWFKLKVSVKKPIDKSISKQQVRKLLRGSESYKGTQDEWKYYLCRIALLTGCRLNEIAQLRHEDIDLKAKQLSIHSEKGNRVKNASSVRKVPINKELEALLVELTGNNSDYLFDLPWSKTNHFANAPSKFYSKLFKQLGIEGSFHSLRHYAITRLFNSGVKEELIGILVGHSVGKLTTGKVYLSGFTFKNQMDAIQHLSIKE